MKTLCPKCMSDVDAKALNMTLVELLPCGSSGAVRRAMCHALSIRQIGFDKSSICSKHPDQAAVTMKSLCLKCVSEIDAKALNMTLVELLPCGSSGAVRRSMCHALSIRQIGFDKSSICSKHPDQAAVTMKSLCLKCMSETDAKALDCTLVELPPCGSSGAVRRSMCHAL